MIITTQQNQYEVVGDPVENQSMMIDENGLEFLFKAFSDTLYSDKIGSIVREITSNCFDSHEEAGVKQAVMIHLREPSYSDTTNGSITFEDFGVGISPERMTNIFRKYFSSTKRGTNNEIVGFGIGSKSPLSYTSTFTIITRFNKIEYTYVINRGEKTPIVSLISKESTEEHNGTQVIIPVRNRADYLKFLDAIKKQLKFFDNVVINHYAFNDFNNQRIFRGEHFIVRENDKELRRSGICLGKVYYPLNHSQIDEYEWNFETPICLYFNIGEIGVTLNREAIDYNETVIEKVKEKFKLAKKELEEMILSQGNEYDDLMEYLSQHNKDVKLKIKDSWIPVKGFVRGDVIAAKYAPLKDTPIKIPAYPFFDYKISHRINGNKMVKEPGTDVRDVFTNKRKVFRLKDSLGKRKSLYLSDIHGEFFIVKKHTDTLFNEKTQLLGLTSLSKEDQQKYVEIFDKEILKYIIKNSESYDKTEIPETWLKNYLESLKDRSKLVDKIKHILCHIPDNTGTFRQYYMDTESIQKFIAHKGKKFIYGDSSDELSLYRIKRLLELESYLHDNYWGGTIPKDAVFFVAKVSRENIKILKDLPNTVHVKDFVNQYPKIFLRAYYRAKLNKLRPEVNTLMNYTDLMGSRAETILSQAYRVSKYYETEEWIGKIVEYNEWDIPVFFSGDLNFTAREIFESTGRLLEDLEPLTLMDRQQFYKKDRKYLLEVASGLLKVINPQNYVHAKKNLCRS